MTGLPRLIQREAMTGILEQRFLSPKGGISSLVMYHTGGLVIWILGTALVFLAALLVTRSPLHFSLGIFSIALLILMGIEGVGFLLAGLALLFKRIGAVTQLMQRVLLGLALLPTDRLPVPWQTVVQTLPPACPC